MVGGERIERWQAKPSQRKRVKKLQREKRRDGVPRRIDIANFRGIKKLSLNLDETTALIGENNTSKTSILDAIQLCLGRTLREKSTNFFRI